MNLALELERGITQLGLQVNPDKQVKLLAYLALLHKWNQVYNLTAIRNPQQMVSNHLLDSLAVLPYLQAGKWLDVGCGAGLPGVVLAIAEPEWQITLLDSNSKKTGFVQQAAIELGLTNVKVCCARVEDFVTEAKFDGIISRAFTELGGFIALTRHLLAPDGHWAAMKGNAEREISEMPKDCIVESFTALQVPGLVAARSLVMVSQQKAG